MTQSLEILRVATTFLVVMFHASLAYLTVPLRHTIWLVHDIPTFGLNYFCYWVNGFAMPVFFLAAGVSAPAAIKSRGVQVFLTHRVRRLLRPLVFASLTVLPIVYVLWGYGLMKTGRCDLDDILNWRFRPELRTHLYGLGHLWFLEYLFVVCVAWCLAAKLRDFAVRKHPNTPDEAGWIARILVSPWRPLLLAIPTAVIFLVDSDTMLRINNDMIPNPFRVLHYTYFFAVGGWISRIRKPGERLIPLGGVYLVLSIAVFALMSGPLLRHAESPLHGPERIALCAFAAPFPWLMLFGSLGVLLRLHHAKGSVLRYLSEASFWVYIVHLPLVGLGQVLLYETPLPGLVKFAFVAGLAIAASLLSYEFIVRFSLIGEIINGARKRTSKAGRLGTEFGWIASVVVLALIFAYGTWYSRVFFWNNNFYEEIPGQLYRSARLSPKDLDAAIKARGLKTVVTFGGGDHHPWYQAQQKTCGSRGVEIHAITLKADRLPSRESVHYLMNLLEHSPRPILVQGYRGLDHASFAAAVGRMLQGTEPADALREFDGKYGQFGGAKHSILGKSLIDYQTWLAANKLPHAPLGSGPGPTRNIRPSSRSCRKTIPWPGSG